MTDVSQTITDNSDIRRYFAIVEHMADDDLGLYEYRLLGHYKRVCGANGGRCTESVRTTASKIKGMSVGQVSKSRRELERLGWITVQKVNERTTPKGYTVCDGISIRLVDRMAENVARYAKEGTDTRSHHEQVEGVTCSPREHPCSPHEPKKNLDQEEQEIGLPPADAGEGPHGLFNDGQTVYVWSDKRREYMECTVVKETGERVKVRWANGSTVKEFYRAKHNVKTEKPVLKRLEDFTPLQQVVMRWTRNVKPGEGVPGDTVEFANTVLKQLAIRFGSNGSAPTAPELDAAWAFAKANGLTYRDPDKIPAMVNDYRDQKTLPVTLNAHADTHRRADPHCPHCNGNGVLRDTSGALVACACIKVVNND